MTESSRSGVAAAAVLRWCDVPAIRRGIALLLLVAGLASCRERTGPAPGRTGSAVIDVSWAPTPHAVVAKMLEVAQVGPDDILYDLGCGDGRIVAAAAKRFGTKGVCVELDPERIADIRQNLKRQGVEQHVTVIEGNLFDVDLSPATVITLYLLPSLNLRLRPTLWKLKPGTRIVSNDYDMGDWKPEQTIHLGQSVVYYWEVPASRTRFAEPSTRR